MDVTETGRQLAVGDTHRSTERARENRRTLAASLSAARSWLTQSHGEALDELSLDGALPVATLLKLFLGASGCSTAGPERQRSVTNQEMGYCAWSLAASEDAFMWGSPDEPRNWHRLDEAGTRSMYSELADDVLTQAPARSNDFELSALLEEVVSKLPRELRPSGEAIFAVRTASREANAEAWIEFSRLGQIGHLIGVYDGMNIALYAYSIIARKCHQLHIDQRPEAHRTTPIKRFKKSTARFSELLADPSVAYVLDTRKRWAADESKVDLDGPMADVINGFDDRLEDGLASHEAGRLLALRFIVAHEVAHHLLGHTHDEHLAKCEFPAQEFLVDAKAQLRLTHDGDWTYRQQQEMDADAFGFLMLAGWLVSADVDVRAWAGVTSGAFVALPVLQDLSKTREGPLRGKRLTEVGGDYPPLLARIEQLAQVVAAVSQRIDPRSPMHPWGAVVQGLIFGQFLLWSRAGP